MERPVNRLLDQRAAAEILGISVRTLERHRLTGTGPQFCQLGRLVRYRELDLEEWIERSLRRSTSEILRDPLRRALRKAEEQLATDTKSVDEHTP
jgi:predicted DNA-binding transcriptional regulator AlpA